MTTHLKQTPIDPAHILTTYSADEARQWAHRWLEVFGRDRQGMSTKAYMWHVLSGGRYPSVSGEQAAAAYAEQTGAEFVVLSNDRISAVLSCVRPESRTWSDCYVFPPNLAWTMVFTHEDGWLGPYFARHRDYAALELENQAALRKAKEKDAARQKGWL